MGAIRIRAGGLGADDALRQSVFGSIGIARHREPVALCGGSDEVFHGHESGVGSRGGRGSAASLNDGGAALLHSLDKLTFQPLGIGDHLGYRFAADFGVGEVRVLGGGVVAPNRHIGDGGNRYACLGSQLALGSKLVEHRHGKEVLLRQSRGVVEGDEAVRVAGVTDDEHLAIRRGVFCNGFALTHEDLTVDAEQILALHAGLTGHGPHEHAPVGVFESDSRVIRGHNFFHEGEGAVIQLHHHAMQLIQTGSDFEQLKNDGLILAQHVSGSNAEKQGISDIAGSTGHSDSYGSLHTRGIMLFLRGGVNANLACSYFFWQPAHFSVDVLNDSHYTPPTYLERWLRG